jgi:hypothetical protein
MPKQVQIRRDTAALWTSTNPTLAEGELGMETDTGKLKIGNGTNTWKQLTYLATTSPAGPLVQGNSTGYAIGGTAHPAVTSNRFTTIDTFAFASDGDATDIGDIPSDKRYLVAPSTSSSHAYYSGGGPSVTNEIIKIPFSTPIVITDVGDLSAARTSAYGGTSSTNGYAAGGRTPTPISTIDKYPFSTDANATDVGDLTLARYNVSGSANCSSSVAVYGVGGTTGSLRDIIDKMPFSAEGTATDVGDIGRNGHYLATCNSQDHGYSFAQYPAPTSVNREGIDKFSYSSDGDSTITQDLFRGVWGRGSSSSTSSGYATGGRNYPGDPTGQNETLSNSIDKFPFANNSTGTDVGDLTAARYSVAGNQV